MKLWLWHHLFFWYQNGKVPTRNRKYDWCLWRLGYRAVRETSGREDIPQSSAKPWQCQESVDTHSIQWQTTPWGNNHILHVSLLIDAYIVQTDYDIFMYCKYYQEKVKSRLKSAYMVENLENFAVYIGAHNLLS